MFVPRVCCHKSLPFCGLLRVQKKEGWLSTRVFPSFGKNDISSLNNTAQTPPPRLSNDADSISQWSTQFIIVTFIESLSWLLSFVFMLIDSGARRAQLLLKICCKVVVVSPCNWLFATTLAKHLQVKFIVWHPIHLRYAPVSQLMILEKYLLSCTCLRNGENGSIRIEYCRV